MPELTRRELISAGFQDLDKARSWLASPELSGMKDHSNLIKLLGVAPRVDEALPVLVRLLERSPRASQIVAEFVDSSGQGNEPVTQQKDGAAAGGNQARALLRLLGASPVLGEFLIRHPEQLELIDLARATSEPPRIGERAKDLQESLSQAVLGVLKPEDTTQLQEDKDAKSRRQRAVVELRTRYRRHLIETLLWDVEAEDPTERVGNVSADLSDLAAAAFDAALLVARHEAKERFGVQSERVRLAVIGMGKCGARELNYLSDVDVMYVVSGEENSAETETTALTEEELVRIGTVLASHAGAVLSQPGLEPALWEVDANLRPEGQDGALVRSMDSYRRYYERWAHNWEFQALLKARTIAGDQALGREFENLTRPLVFSSSSRDGFVQGVQHMRARVSNNIPADEAARQIKLGEGGLRDVEFTVQLLQLVHGKTDESLHVRDTLSAIDALCAAGYIGRADRQDLSLCYKFLRVLEHRLQVARMRRTHLMPESHQERALLARSLPLPGGAETLSTQWNKVKRRVRQLHEQIFFRPLLASAASLSEGEIRLSPEDAKARLRALGYLDPVTAMRHIESMSTGVQRRAVLQRQLLPVLLGWFAEGVNPDAALLAFRKLSEALGESPWFLRMLRDSNAGAWRLSRLLSTSRLVAEWLEFSPQAVQWLGEDSSLRPRDEEALSQEISAKIKREPDPQAAARFVRLLRRREMMRVALAEGSGLIDAAQVRLSLGAIDRSCVAGVLRIAEAQEFSLHPQLVKMSVIAMGRQGGDEITYGSDADVLYVYSPVKMLDSLNSQVSDAQAEAQAAQAQRIVTSLQSLLSQSTLPPIPAELVLKVDAALRPEGKQGPLVRSLDSYREYYERWGELWEFQALLRARHMAGDEGVSADFLKMIEPFRYPEKGLDSEQLTGIRRMKARVEGERLPRGADPARHLKLGRGSLSDVEWFVQSEQLQWAWKIPALRTTSTLDALEALRVQGHVSDAEAVELAAAWMLASEVRGATMIYNGRATDLLPSKSAELESVARWVGREAGSGHALEEEYLRVTRRARGIFESHFYG